MAFNVINMFISGILCVILEEKEVICLLIHFGLVNIWKMYTYASDSRVSASWFG